LVELAAGVGSVLVGGQRMSRRSREAVNLARGLWVYWDLGPGGVEVAWTDGWFGERYRQGYEVRWTDGPTVARMRAAAEQQVHGGPAIDKLVRGRLVRYERSLSLGAWAVKLVTHVRDGGQVPDLDHPAVSETWRAGLERAEFPERARTAQEQALAGRLVKRAMRDYRQTVVAADRARTARRRPVPWAPPEVLLARSVAAEGLEGAASVAHEQDPAGAGESVVDLDRYRQTRDLGGDGRALE
jgi:hypothetical protein